MKKTIAIARILTVCAFLAMTGCASLPSPEVMKSETAAYQLPDNADDGN
jgi:hypothetical protein